MEKILESAEVLGVNLACKERLKHLKLELETLNLEGEDVLKFMFGEEDLGKEDEHWYQRVFQYFKPNFARSESIIIHHLTAPTLQ